MPVNGGDAAVNTGAVVATAPARISASCRFHLSVVGAVSLMVTEVADAGVGTVVDWTQ